MVYRFSFSAICIAFFAGCFWGHSVNDKEVALDEEDGGVSGAHDVASLPPEITFPCLDDFDGVYAAQATTEDALGAVIACQVDHEADLSEVSARLMDADVSGVEVKAGYRAYRIAYRTNRDAQTTGTGTGRLYLPDLPGPRPIVVVAHGTAGLADRCAPSRYPPAVSSDVLAMPWVASGFVTVLPDYAGLGNPGVQGYGNRPDTTFSIVDAARVAAAVLNTSNEFVVVGHSQGGGASLSTQALAGNYGSPDVELIAAVSIAGNLKEDKTLNTLRFPSIPIRGGGGVMLVATLYSLYADWAHLVGEARGGEILHPDIRNHVVASIENECVFETVVSVNTDSAGYEVPDTVGTIVDPTLREAIVSCDRDDNCTNETAATLHVAALIFLSPMPMALQFSCQWR